MSSSGSSVERSPAGSRKARWGASLYRRFTCALSCAIRPWVLRTRQQWRWTRTIALQEQQVLVLGDSPSPLGGEPSGQAGPVIGGQRERSGGRRQFFWLHAASAGEFEMIWGIARQLRQSDPGCDLALTLFSPSGETRLSNFQREFQPVYCGPSPWEGEWGQFLERLSKLAGAKPMLFITAKYEAWPELWGTLFEQDIPLLLTNAEWRSSIRWAVELCARIFGGVPRLKFAPVSLEVETSLRAGLSQVEHLCAGRVHIQVLGDPRWDQVGSRMGRRNPRILEMEQLAREHQWPRPWVVVGSAWEEDLEILLRGAGRAQFSGTLWLVPHRLSSGQEQEWKVALADAGWQSVWTTRGGPAEVSESPEAGAERVEPCFPVAVLVQEMGILVELYSLADAAWVGGGFRTGLHSVIEPAWSGLPIGAGAARASGFPEARALAELGQLTLARTDEQVTAWFNNIQGRGVENPMSALQEIEGTPKEIEGAWSGLVDDPSAQSEAERWRSWREQSHVGASRRLADWALEIVSARDRV